MDDKPSEVIKSCTHIDVSFSNSSLTILYTFGELLQWSGENKLVLNPSWHSQRRNYNIQTLSIACLCGFDIAAFAVANHLLLFTKPNGLYVLKAR